MARFKQSAQKGPSLQQQHKRRIQHILSQDRTAIRRARDVVVKRAGFDLLDESEQKRRLAESAKTRIQTRIDAGLHVSCNYPEFTGYLPPSFYGHAGQVKDPEKDERLKRQLKNLPCELVGDDDDDDDDEDPLPIKAEGNTKQQKMSEFLQFVETQEARLSKDTTNPGHKESNNGADKNDKTATAGRRSKGRNTKPTKVDKSHYNSKNNSKVNNKKETITWRAVSRGQPLLAGSPAPNVKQWEPKSNPWLGRVVFRGQSMAEDSKNDD
jgi:hypothetical protein